MPLDPKTGLITAQDEQPYKVRVLSDGNPANTKVVDAKTGKPLDGVTRIEFVMTPQGSELRLAFGPACYELVMLDQPVTAEDVPAAQLVDIKSAKPVTLMDGDQIVIATPEGTPQAVLTAAVVTADGRLPLGDPDAEDPMKSKEVGAQAGDGDDERPPRRALGQKEDA